MSEFNGLVDEDGNLHDYYRAMVEGRRARDEPTSWRQLFRAGLWNRITGERQ